MPRPSRWRRLEQVSAWLVAMLAVIAAVLALLVPRFGPSPGPGGWLGFAAEVVAAQWLPIGVLAAVAAIAAGLRRRRGPALVLGLVAALALVPVAVAVAFAPGSRVRAESPVLRVASVNLRGESFEDPRTVVASVAAMVDAVRELDADVLVLLEYTNLWAAQLEQSFAGDYAHRWLAAPPEREGFVTDGLRIAVWSRVPAAGAHEVLLCGGYNAAIRVPLRWRERDFRVYGIHPWKQWPYRLYRSALRDRQQLLDWMQGETLPMLLAGDFNASPRSAFVVRLRAVGLANSSEEVLGLAPPTWPMDRPELAPFRVAIDHVMHCGAFAAVGFGRGKPTCSDHALVLAELTWREH